MNLHFHFFPLVLDGVEKIRILSFCGRGGSQGSGKWISLHPVNSPSTFPPSKAEQSYLGFGCFPGSHAEAMGIDGGDIEWQVIHSLPRFSLLQSHMGGMRDRVRQVIWRTSGNRTVKSLGIILEWIWPLCAIWNLSKHILPLYLLLHAPQTRLPFEKHNHEDSEHT